MIEGRSEEMVVEGRREELEGRREDDGCVCSFSWRRLLVLVGCCCVHLSLSLLSRSSLPLTSSLLPLFLAPSLAPSLSPSLSPSLTPSLSPSLSPLSPSLLGSLLLLRLAGWKGRSGSCTSSSSTWPSSSNN
eukprot:3925671-Rhodomonas_salina.1